MLRCENCNKSFDLDIGGCLCDDPRLGHHVEGVGKDAPVVTNEKGGKQSDTKYRADLLPPIALLQIARVLKEGADKYGAENWRKISQADNLNHALIHILAYLAGNREDDHLQHAGCRILFALETE